MIISSRINQLNAETLAEEDVIFGSKIMYYVVIYDISGVSDAKYESLIPIKYLGDCVNDFYIMVLLTHYQKNRLKKLVTTCIDQGICIEAANYYTLQRRMPRKINV